MKKARRAGETVPPHLGAPGMLRPESRQDPATGWRRVLHCGVSEGEEGFPSHFPGVVKLPIIPGIRKLT